MALDLATLQSRFSLPQADAANELGISLTSLKQVCRKLGISRWPYHRLAKQGGKRRSKSSKEARGDVAAARASVSHNEQANQFESFSSASSPTPLRRGPSSAIETLCEIALLPASSASSAVIANPSLKAKVLAANVHKQNRKMVGEPDDGGESGLIAASLLCALSKQKSVSPHQAPPTILPPLSSIVNSSSVHDAYGLSMHMGRVEQGGQIPPRLQNLAATTHLSGQAMQGFLQYPYFFPTASCSTPRVPVPL